MRNLVTLVLISVLFVGCESDQVAAPEAAFSKKPKGCAICSDYVVFDHDNGSVLVLDHNDLKTTASFELGTYVDAVVRNGNYVYLWQNAGNFYAVDLSNPAAPTSKPIGLYETPLFSNFQVVGKTMIAQATDHSGRLMVFRWDLSDPSQPVEAGIDSLPNP